MLRKSKMLVSWLMVVVMVFGCCIPATAAVGETVGTFAALSPTFVEITSPSAYMKVGDSMTLDSVVMPANLTVSYSWYTSNSSIATVNSSGKVTAKKQGTVTIGLTVSTTGPFGGSLTDTITIYIYDAAGIEMEETYYIMNASSKRLLSVETASDANKTNVYTRPRTSATNMSEWTVYSHGSYGFKLKSNYSISGKCLDVTGTNVDIFDDNGENYLKFTIERVENGAYEGLYLIKYNNSYYVTQDANYNVYVTTTLSEASYWSFMAKEKRYAELFCFDFYIQNLTGLPPEQTRFRTDDNFYYFRDTFNDMNYDTAWSYTNNTASAAYSQCLTVRDDVFVFIGHGTPGGIAFYNSNSECTGAILADRFMRNDNIGDDRQYITDIAENGLSQARMIFYLGCETGCDYVAQIGHNSCNLVDETYEKGAHFVLGITEVMYNTTVDDWLKYFLDALNNGENISTAIASADEELGRFEYPEYDSQGTESITSREGLPIYSRGDSLQYLDAP